MVVVMASVCFSICAIADVNFDCWGTAWDTYNLGLQNLIRELLYTIAVFGEKNAIIQLLYWFIILTILVYLPLETILIFNTSNYKIYKYYTIIT